MYVTIPGDVFDTSNTPIRVARRPGTARRTFKAGTYVFHEGDDARRIYEVVSGVLRLTRVMENGRRQVIAFGYPGDIVGFPNGQEYHTDCDVLSTATLIQHRRECLETGEGGPALQSRLLQAALSEISSMQDHFMMLGRKSAGEKVASFLYVLSQRVGDRLGSYTQVELPMSRSDIADFLGLTTETISRTLTQMRKCDVIALENIHTVVVLRPDALLALAEGSNA